MNTLCNYRPPVYPYFPLPMFEVPAGSLVIIQGPANTGKSQLAKELVTEIARRNDCNRVIVADDTNIVIPSKNQIDTEAFLFDFGIHASYGESMVLVTEANIDPDLFAAATVVIRTFKGSRPDVTKRPLQVMTKVPGLEIVIHESMTRDRFIAELINVTESREWGNTVKQLESELMSVYDGYRATLKNLAREGKLKDDEFVFHSLKNSMTVSFKGKFLSPTEYDTKINVQLNLAEHEIR